MRKLDKCKEIRVKVAVFLLLEIKTLFNSWVRRG